MALTAKALTGLWGIPRLAPAQSPWHRGRARPIRCPRPRHARRVRCGTVTHTGAFMRFWFVFLASMMLARAGAAQSPAEHIALGDSLYAQFKPDEAFAHYIAAIGPDSSNYEALWKSARS